MNERIAQHLLFIHLLGTGEKNEILLLMRDSENEPSNAESWLLSSVFHEILAALQNVCKSILLYESVETGLILVL